MVTQAKTTARQAALAARARGGLIGPSAQLLLLLEPLISGAVRVASYVPVGHEPGVTPRRGWLLPVLRADGDLDWAAYDGRLVPGPHGLREPAGPRLGVGAVAGCDLVLVPALRVDRAGHRLGRGGGSYDRALPRVTGLAVALLNDGELVQQVPTEPHDARVHAAVTPSSGLVRLWGG